LIDREKEKAELSYKKTARDLRTVAFDTLEVLTVNFIVFYYLIYQASKVDDQPWLDLKAGLKYSYEALFNNHAWIFSLVVGFIAFMFAYFIRPKSVETSKICSPCIFGFFRRLSRSLLSLAITLSMFKFVALTHGHFGDKADFWDFTFFLISIYTYIGLNFVLLYDNKNIANKNISNFFKALKIIIITILVVLLVAALISLELYFQCFSQSIRYVIGLCQFT
jgi:hypothetical protein